MKVATPRLYLGTMTFGWSQTSSVVDEPVAKEMVKKFVTFNKKNSISKHYIDTARIYAGGATEPIVGASISDASSYCSFESLLVGTKAHPSQPGGLSMVGIQQQSGQRSLTNRSSRCLGNSCSPLTESHHVARLFVCSCFVITSADTAVFFYIHV